MKNKLLISVLYALGCFLFGSTSCTEEKTIQTDKVTFTKNELLNKIKGGWAGQTIGVTYGGPTEFRYQGGIIQDYVPIEWPEHYIKWWFDKKAGLYDDVYMDLTFVDVFDRCGLDAPVDSFAMAFANANYPLWHANQSARYNILNGIMPPASGNWKNNPHSNDIDYQIEADFAGLMSPGMPNASSEISDKIGHIMNYGDGWYGGVYVGAMYALAFISDDINYVVSEALKTIPQQSLYHQCIQDIIKWHKENPKDWKYAWFECDKKYNKDLYCPYGIFTSYNIDATINSAYVVIGLLYGDGDFFKTMDIATRCGQDSDCNPATAAGILGTMIGYDKIPERWMDNLREIENINFPYTNLTLNKVYQLSLNQALQVIKKNNGKVENDQITIQTQIPKSVRFEKGFANLYPDSQINIYREIKDVYEISFEGIGIILTGEVKSKDKNYVAEVGFYIDDQLVETVKLPADFLKRRNDLFWKFDLNNTKHKLTVKWINPNSDSHIHINKGISFINKE